MAIDMDGEYTYAGIHPACGGWVAVAVDCESNRRDLTGWLPDWLKRGLNVQRVRTECIRTGEVSMCECKRKKKQPSLFEEVRDAE